MTLFRGHTLTAVDLTVDPIVLHLLHDLELHVLDVRRGRARLVMAGKVPALAARSGTRMLRTWGRMGTMAFTSSLVPLGTPAPAFTLPDVGGTLHSLSDFTAPVLVVAFLCNHCPYVKHIELALGRLKPSDQVDIVAISSNDAERYPDDAPPQLADQAERAGWAFPYLVDADQTVARANGAVCTPDFFVYGPGRRLAYRGAFDASTPGNGEPVTGADLTNAIALVAAGHPVPEPHRPSMGCGIKWLPGNEHAGDGG